ncbi:FMN-linked oxidoreductase [Xylariaceae sp. FL0804]|nr:FMN-linked oxidoreductase [Xylariaceae sp. FL0804]
MAASHRTALRCLSASSRPALRPLAPRPAARRMASTTSSATGARPLTTLRTAVFATSLVASGAALYVYMTDTRAFVHRYVVPPLLRALHPDAEEAHNAAVAAMRQLYDLGLHPRERGVDDPDLAVPVWGQQWLANPIGISAGLDKHAEVPDALFALGAAVVEVGGCTPRPQDGNPRPRMFRVPGLDGLVNRYGLNSDGADAMALRLQQRVRRFARSAGLGLSEADVLDGAAGVPPGSLAPGRLLLVQVAKNKETDERDVEAVRDDYVYCVNRLARYADVLVVNVSSPNTPGLRDLQAVEPLTRILGAVVDEARRTDRRGGARPRVMVKVSPDEDEDAQVEGIVQAVWASGVDGVIVGNTTKRRVGVVPPGVAVSPAELATLNEVGGYSGPMMFDRTVDLVRRYRKLLDGQQHQQSAQPAAEEKKVEEVANEAAEASIAAIDGTISGPPSASLATTTGSGSKSKIAPESAATRTGEQKVIFATGGVTNGKQALEMLNAGASVAMVYTAMVYGGAGTVTRIKREMQRELAGKEA